MEKKILKELTKVVGEKNVLFSQVDLLSYCYDASIDKALPDVIVFPSNTLQVSEIVKIAREYKIPFLPRGAGTNLSGGTVPVKGGIVISLTKMNKVLEINTENGYAVVEPGVVNLDLQNVLAENDFFFAPDPASQKVSTIGGNIAENAGGPHCLKYGVTSNNVLGLEIVLPDGEIIQTDICSNGYDIIGLFVGSEGTLGIVTKAKLKILPSPPAIKTILVSFDSVEDAIESVTEIISEGIIPATLEAMDRNIISAIEKFIHSGYPLDAEAVLLIEIDGEKNDVEKESEIISEICKKNRAGEIRIAKTEEERNKLWEGRQGAYPSMTKLYTSVLVEDGTVPRDKLPEILKRIKEIGEKYNLKICNVFHAGDGNIHPQFGFDERNIEETKKVRKAGEEILRECVKLGGSVSGEHGIGIDKINVMKDMFSKETLDIFRKIKSVFDPYNLCNPGKIIPMSSNIKSDNSFCKNKIIEYDQLNFTVTVGADVKYDELQRFLLEKKQMLLINPEKEDISLGEIVSSGYDGIKDLVLGMKIKTSRGDVINFSGSVMKNVAGYDIGKLFIGSFGTLGEVLEVTLKLLPFTEKDLKISKPKKIDFSDKISKKIESIFS